MTSYQGGKKKIGKRIYKVISLIEKDIAPNVIHNYFEPFVGMAGVLRYFGKENYRNVFASDINIDLIMMWNSLQKGWKPLR